MSESGRDTLHEICDRHERNLATAYQETDRIAAASTEAEQRVRKLSRS